MITKHKSWLFAALFVLTGLFSAQAQNAVHPKAYYDAIKYQWTDASGVSHENAITDLATDPYQIVALLKKVYCDPNLPGPKFTAYKQDGTRERKVYYGAVTGGWNISASEVTEPYEEGYTILMVALNNTITKIGSDTQQLVNIIEHLFFPDEYEYDTFKSNFFTTTNELIDYIRNNVTSVQLLTDGLRMGQGEMAGTVFNISGNYNRFFILSKGQSRQKDSYVTDREKQSSTYPVIAGEYVPFKSMFEQFSPTDGSKNSEITDFYAKMVGGQLYPVLHDCSSVIENEHEFSMSGKAGTEYKSLTGLNIFIPDYRLKYWEDHEYYVRYDNGSTYGPYDVDGRTMNPYMRLDSTQFVSPGWLCAHYAQYNQEHAPKMGIYTVDLAGKAVEAAEPETYNVVLNWESSLDAMAGHPVPQNYILYLVTTDEDGNEVNEQLIITDQTSYTYSVPQDDHSYILTYVVFARPSDGEHDMFVAWSNTADVVIPGTEDFLALKLNHFESDFEPSMEANFYRNFLSIANLDELNALTPERVNAGENSFVLYRFDAANPEVKTPAATITLTTAGNGVRYEINYLGQEYRPNYTIPAPSTSGVLSVVDGMISFQGLELVDQFMAEVADNMHPNRYGYMIALSDNSKSTNTVEVPVYKADASIEGYYTQQQVIEDTDAKLTAGIKNANVKMNLSANQQVYYYSLYRGDNATPNQEISNLQHNTDGSYTEKSNFFADYYNLPAQPGVVERFDNKEIQGEYGNFMSYAPVVGTFGEDRVNNKPESPDDENTYGSPILKTGVAAVDGEVDGTVSMNNTYVNWVDENGDECAIYNPSLTINATMPEYASVDYAPYMYRIWRKCDNIRNYRMSATTHRPVNVENAPRDPFKLIVEQYTSDNQIQVGGNNTLAFGATLDSRIEGISFLVRLYYKKITRDGEHMYYVVEKELPWNNVTTGVNEINAAGEVAKTYYNAQGIASDKPYDGVNIVVTKYSDGTSKTTKVVVY